MIPSIIIIFVSCVLHTIDGFFFFFRTRKPLETGMPTRAAVAAAHAAAAAPEQAAAVAPEHAAAVAADQSAAAAKNAETWGLSEEM